jgi:predicted secreted protein
MRTLFKSFFCLSLLLGLSIAKVYATPTVAALPFSNPQKSIVVTQADPQFTISLASNPTTGYSWFLESYDANLLSLVKHKYNRPAAPMPGAGGFETWVFAVKPEAFAAPQITKINLMYARPWNLNDNNKKTGFTVVIH